MYSILYGGCDEEYMGFVRVRVSVWSIQNGLDGEYGRRRRRTTLDRLVEGGDYGFSVVGGAGL